MFSALDIFPRVRDDVFGARDFILNNNRVAIDIIDRDDLPSHPDGDMVSLEVDFTSNKDGTGTR